MIKNEEKIKLKDLESIEITKENLSEDYAGSNWLYTIVNDSIIEKTMAAGGNTYYFIKKDKAYFNQVLNLGSCN